MCNLVCNFSRKLQKKLPCVTAPLEVRKNAVCELILREGSSYRRCWQMSD